MRCGLTTRRPDYPHRRTLGIEGDRHDEPDFDPHDPENREKAEELRAQVREILLTRTGEEWVDTFGAAGAPVSPVNYPQHVAADPHAGLMFADIEHEVAGTQRQMGPLFGMAKTPTAIAGPAPLVGQHTGAGRRHRLTAGATASRAHRYTGSKRAWKNRSSGGSYVKRSPGSRSAFSQTAATDSAVTSMCACV